MRIAICSCADYRDNPGSYPVWTRIQGENPDLLLLLGDNVYLPQSVKPEKTEELRVSLTQEYRKLLADQKFQALLAYMRTGGRKVAAIYDDHDSIGEDTKAPVMTQAMRDVAQQVFFQHMGFGANPPNLYCSFEMDLARVVMIDARSYRIKDANTLDDVLGTTQAAWFRAQVAAASAKPYLLVCSGFTLYKYWAFPPIPVPVSSGWFHHSQAYAEILQLLAGRPGVLFVSGDIHRNELTMKSDVIELVSSGVARKSLGLKTPLGNYAILDLDAEKATVNFRALKPAEAWSQTITLASWRI